MGSDPPELDQARFLLMQRQEELSEAVWINPPETSTTGGIAQ
jgi:hypothetical protein